VDASLIDPALSEQTALVRRLVELGRGARADSGMKVRQPLSRALASAQGFEKLDADLLAEIASELNVGSVMGIAEAGGSLVDTAAKANFRALGKRFGKAVQQVAAAIAATDAAALAKALRQDGAATITVDGEPVHLSPDEVVVTETPREGWAVESAAGETVALDLHVTAELRRAGLAREVVRLVQEARKTAGLDITDRIELGWSAADSESGRAAAAAIREHADLIAGEVLAVSMTETGSDPGGHRSVSSELGVTFWLRPTR
jgi:isoleucyl-tRNA synthetase